MRSSVTVDIHSYDRIYAATIEQVRASDLSERNKSLIFAYRDACLLQQTCGKVRLIRAMGVLILYAKALDKDFDQASREDVQRVIASFMARQPPYSPQTLGTYKAIIKRFHTYLNDPATYSTRAPAPPLVSWLTTHVKSKDKRRLQRNELLTPTDIEAVIDVARNPRDKALIATLWETGGRVAEIGNLQIKNVAKSEYGYTLDVNGKTGQRTPLIVSSAPYLAAWLNVHPFRDNPEAPVWVHYGTKHTPEELRYATIRNMLKEHFRNAGITKRVYPHLFRHSRSTFLLANGWMSEAQAKAYFGWAPNSDQLATYSHLLASDANSAILRENHLKATTQTADELQPKRCYRCKELNAATNEYCSRCNAVLDLQRAYEHQQLHEMKEELFARMFKVMVDRGLIDEAAGEIHDAGLGSVLKRLALHVSAEVPLTLTAPSVKQNEAKGETKPVVVNQNTVTT